MSNFDQYLASKATSSNGGLSNARPCHVDARVAMYQAFAESERAEESRTERSPLVQWARQGASVKKRHHSNKTPLSQE